MCKGHISKGREPSFHAVKGRGLGVGEAGRYSLDSGNVLPIDISRLCKTMKETTRVGANQRHELIGGKG